MDDDEERELQALSDDLGRAANLEAYGQATEIALVAALVVIHAGILGLIAQDRNLGNFWLLVPLVPYWITGFHMMAGAQGTLRGFYTRAVERRIHQLSRGHLDLDAETQIVAPSYFHLVHVASSSRSGFAEQKVLYIAGIAVMQGLMIAEAIYAVVQVDDVRLQLLGTLIFVGLAALIAAYTYRVTLGGLGLWRYALRSLDAGWARPLGPWKLDNPDRSLLEEPTPPVYEVELARRTPLAYLIHPRTIAETLNKSLLGLVVVGIALARQWSEHSIHAVIAALLYVVIFEFVLYPTRYYLNDVLDSAAKTSAVQRRSRRPMLREDVTVRSAVLSALIHLGAGVLLLVLTAHWGSFSRPVEMVALILLYFGVSTATYEWARRTFPTCPASRVAGLLRFLAYVAALWSGYALRGFVALYAGFGGVPAISALLWFAAGAGFLGTCTVILHLSDMAQIYSDIDPSILRWRRQGHVDFLLRIDDASGRSYVPGRPRYRESSVPFSHPTFALFVLTTPCLVVGTAILLGEHRATRLAAIWASLFVVNAAYLRLRRTPTILWVSTIPILASLIVALLYRHDIYRWYIWAGTPVLATFAYFEWFRLLDPLNFADS